MTAEELAALHPRLFHLCERAAVDGILRHGLWSTERLLAGSGFSEAERLNLLLRRRLAPVPLLHRAFGSVTINDNLPLSEGKLAACLDDGLTPADWLGLLNRKVFFWAREQDAEALLGAAGNVGRAKALLIFDTRSLLEAHGASAAIAAINTGQTRFPMKMAARRGLLTFTPLVGLDYARWRKDTRSGSPRRIKEVVVEAGVPDAGRHVVKVVDV
jgi:hypothetical protein